VSAPQPPRGSGLVPAISTACVQTHAFTSRRLLSFREIELVVPRESGWGGGSCRFLGAPGGDVEVPCRHLCAVMAEGDEIEVTVSDGEGVQYGPFHVHGLTTSLPAGSDCFLFVERSNGFWSGVTVNTFYGRLAILSYACDPA
jgi:hypothetical protein